jgi:hypothetical protein
MTFNRHGGKRFHVTEQAATGEHRAGEAARANDLPALRARPDD